MQNVGFWVNPLLKEEVHPILNNVKHITFLPLNAVIDQVPGQCFLCQSLHFSISSEHICCWRNAHNLNKCNLILHLLDSEGPKSFINQSFIEIKLLPLHPHTLTLCIRMLLGTIQIQFYLYTLKFSSKLLIHLLCLQFTNLLHSHQKNHFL